MYSFNGMDGSDGPKTNTSIHIVLNHGRRVANGARLGPVGATNTVYIIYTRTHKGWLMDTP